MLKKYLFVIVLLFFSSTLFAYEEGEAILYFNGGFGFSMGDDVYYDATPEVMAAWNLGIGFEYFFLKETEARFPINLSFTTGLLYEKQPLSYKDKDYGSKTNFNFTYITIPMGIRILFSEFFFIGSGLYYAKTLGHDVTINSVYMGKLIDVKDDFGLYGDFGLDFKLSDSGSLLLYFRSKMGLVEKQKGSKLKTTAGTLNIACGIRF